jgi:hypothetical protein
MVGKVASVDAGGLVERCGVDREVQAAPATVVREALGRNCEHLGADSEHAAHGEHAINDGLLLRVDHEIDDLADLLAGRAQRVDRRNRISRD